MTGRRQVSPAPPSGPASPPRSARRHLGPPHEALEVGAVHPRAAGRAAHVAGLAGDHEACIALLEGVQGASPGLDIRQLGQLVIEQLLRGRVWNTR